MHYEWCEEHEVIIATKQTEHTTKWISENLPKCKLIFCDSFDKSEVTNGADLFIDDRLDCLESSKAENNLCYGKYKWNEGSEFIRMSSWCIIRRLPKVLSDSGKRPFMLSNREGNVRYLELKLGLEVEES